MTHDHTPNAPRADAASHQVIHQRPLTRMEQKALPVDPEKAPDAYIAMETGEVFEPAEDWGPWKWFGIFMRAVCFFRRDAPGHPGFILSTLLATIGRRRREGAAWTIRAVRGLRPDTHTR